MGKIKCPKCKKPMKYLGNITGQIYLSYPARWDDTYICDKCKTKKTIRCQGQRMPDYSHVNEYKEISDNEGTAKL